MNVRTRFAPSPTGPVHIGNIRVAIYNWLFARHHGGSFLLRVEDTDRERSTPEAIKILLGAMDWLGLDVDEEPLYQSQRQHAHLEVVDALIQKGHAYRAEKGGAGAGECVLFRMPDHAMVFTDAIKGELSKAAEDMDDFVIVRSDGTPVFHLANVLDDIEQQVTHVIRGDDHIENTFRHIALYQALEAPVPVFGHLPMIVNAQGKPYSKRDGDAFIGDFQAHGFLSDALFNYLSLLGWSPGDDREIMSREEMVAAFSLERCQSSAAQVDVKKLSWMNYEYILTLSEEQFRQATEEALKQEQISAEKEQIDQVIPLIRERVKTLSDIGPLSRFLFVDDYHYNEKAVSKKLMKEGVSETLSELSGLLAAVEVFDATSLEELLHAYVEQSGKGFGAVMPPLRIAISGEQGGPDLCPVLSMLGRDEVVRRIARTQERFFD